ncbi:aminoglycoside phosphotransferase family protein [Nocardia yamanashiensis]|uniref:aminoglycoside phosphotransferase family protein n=1 Tax=Nocardia yamanashiensis TaxID=209247 RepID=UPI000A001641|nr:aminoglycoside phosphotransferase family protein [Nocardia yamanashiensis]
MTTDMDAGRIEELHHAVESSCARAGLNPAGAQLIKYTVNAVFRLPTEGVVVRIASGADAADRTRRTVATARWLHDRRAPIGPLLDGDQPIDIDGWHWATFWQELDRAPAWSPAELAAPLITLHTLAPDGALPHWNPFGTARARLAAADRAVVGGDDLRWLTAEWEHAEHMYGSWQHELPLTVIHGDPHTGNLLRRADGQVVLCDLDETGIGPAAWDLVPQAVGATRFVRPAFYRAFAAAYGCDVRREPYFPVLARIRELIMVTGVLPDLSHRPAVAAQFTHRLATLRTGRTSATWDLYT